MDAEEQEEQQQNQPEEEQGSEEIDDDPAVVIDNGSGLIKAGFSGEDNPRCTIPNLIGRPKFKGMAMVGTETKDLLVGLEAEKKRGILNISYPIKHGIIEDWDGMSKIWEHLFTNELRIEPSERNVMLTESPLNPEHNKEKMVEIMFETFCVKGIYIAIQAVLSLYSAGKYTGIVCDSGDGTTNIVPIYDGFSLPHSIIKMTFGGRDITTYLQKILREINVVMTTSSEIEITRDIKEKVCYVALDFDAEAKNFENQNYQMPDGTVITVKDQRFRAPEIMFQPKFAGKEFGGIQKNIIDSIEKCSIDIKKDLYRGIILAGGNTMFPGIVERLNKEMLALSNDAMKKEIQIQALPERKYGVWLGGSLLATIPTFSESWITNEEYKEKGAKMVVEKMK